MGQNRGQHPRPLGLPPGCRWSICSLNTVPVAALRRPGGYVRPTPLLSPRGRLEKPCPMKTPPPSHRASDRLVWDPSREAGSGAGTAARRGPSLVLPAYRGYCVCAFKQVGTGCLVSLLTYDSCSLRESGRMQVSRTWETPEPHLRGAASGTPCTSSRRTQAWALCACLDDPRKTLLESGIKFTS